MQSSTSYSQALKQTLDRISPLGSELLLMQAVGRAADGDLHALVEEELD